MPNAPTHVPTAVQSIGFGQKVTLASSQTGPTRGLAGAPHTAPRPLSAPTTARQASVWPAGKGKETPRPRAA